MQQRRRRCRLYHLDQGQAGDLRRRRQRLRRLRDYASDSADIYSTGPASGPDAPPGTTGGGVKAPSPSTNPSGEGKCSTATSGPSNGQSLPGASLCKYNSAYDYVYVHRKAGASHKCDDSTLTVQNGL